MPLREMLRSMQVRCTRRVRRTLERSSHAFEKLSPTMARGIASSTTPARMATDPTTLPACPSGETSPYPTVVKVTSMHLASVGLGISWICISACYRRHLVSASRCAGKRCGEQAPDGLANVAERRASLRRAVAAEDHQLDVLHVVEDGAEEECADQDEDDGDGEGARREGEGFEEDGGVGVVPRNLEDANHAEHLQHVAGDLDGVVCAGGVRAAAVDGAAARRVNHEDDPVGDDRDQIHPPVRRGEHL
mmetsp:Transcript_37781/g.118972  ORF Transcript_37781/g.118972 Transcript_37781/m.118972 type:complete len:248 (+) Transcript_37781:273-1016(+)